MARRPEANEALRKAPRVRPDDIQAIPPFEPGQLITAADFNRLVDALKALDRRLSALERRERTT